MSNFVRNLTIVLALLSVGSGIFFTWLLAVFHIQIAVASELRWALIIGMPILLFVSFARLNTLPAKGNPAIALQSSAQLAIFLAPYLWVTLHAQ